MLRKLLKYKSHQKYFLRDGRQVVGASSIAKIGENVDGLIHWAWKKGKAGEDYKAHRDAAADAGTVCHALIEAYLIGDELDHLSDFTEEAQKEAREGFEEFKKWWEQEKMVFMHSELQLVSHDYGYGGTLDIVARDPQRRVCLLDIKHTNSIRESHARQLAGYEFLYGENYPDDKIARRAILQTKGGMNPKWFGPMDKYFTTFKAQLNLLNALKAETYK
jgi:hypothetical protein